MKKILLVDLDDTLLDFKKGMEASIEAIFKMHNVPFTRENIDLYEAINSKYWQQYERKEIEREVILSERFRTFFSLFGIDVEGQEENKLYFEGLQKNVFFIYHSIELLNKCKELGMTICLVSNGVNAVQVPRLKLSGIDKYLTKCYVSELIGYAKPSKEFFLPILKDFPNQKNDMVILGDSLTSDIQGGKNVGITTVWFNPKHKEGNLADYSIDNLMDFFSLDIMK